MVTLLKNFISILILLVALPALARPDIIVNPPKAKYFGDKTYDSLSLYNLYPKEIAAAEEYLNSYQILLASFKQSNKAGKISYGKLVIAKPGKIRCEYLKPSKLLLIIKNNHVTLYDYDIDETSHASIDTNALKMLAMENISFRSLNLVELTKDHHFLSLSVKEYSPELKQNLIVTLKFSYPNVELKQISVETEENEMDMVLEQIVYDQPVSNKLFQFHRGLIER